jgi:hypothetical protein
MSTKISNSEATKILSLYLKCQSIIHSIDELSDSVSMKREFKQKTNSFSKFVEKHLDSIGYNIDAEEADYYNKIVAKLDDVTNSIVLHGNS